MKYLHLFYQLFGLIKKQLSLWLMQDHITAVTNLQKCVFRRSISAVLLGAFFFSLPSALAQKIVQPVTPSQVQKNRVPTIVKPPAAVKPPKVEKPVYLLAHLPMLKPLPKPPKPISRKAHQALRPVFNYNLSDLDSATVKAVVQAIETGDYDKAVSLRNILSDQSALSLVNWFYYRKAVNHYSTKDVAHFLDRHRGWPNLYAIKKNAELSGLKDDKTAEDIIALFKRRQPITKKGKVRLAIALKEKGRLKEALRLIRPIWHSSKLGKRQTAELFTNFGEHFTGLDHEKRVNYLLYQHKRKYVAAAKRLFKYLPAQSQKIQALRLRYITSRRVKHTLFDKLDEKQKLHAGLLFNRAKWLRRRKRQTEAWGLLAQDRDPKDPSLLPNSEWKERRLQIRKALNNGHAPIAYAIARQHGKLSGKNAAEATFMAGWLALRFMNQPKQALRHFSQMKKLYLDQHKKAKLHYWLGRTYKALTQPRMAQKHWEISAKSSHSYYGQLSSYFVSSSLVSHGLRQLPPISKKDAATFARKDIVRAIIIAHKTGMHSMKGRLIRHLSWTLPSPAHMALLAELTHHIGKKRDIIKLAKVGIYRQVPLDIYAYPSNALPKDYQKLNSPVEKDLIAALVRQESEFNRQAQSHVGARGLMQLMPGTARQVARQYKISYSKTMLTVSPSYNVMLGSALLRDLLDKYNGSYILTLIAYNAGPGRSNKWSEAFGNPGDHDVDAIDWVERIPFKETRQYVKKILSSLQYFRHRSGVSRPMRLMTDLKRGGSLPTDPRPSSIE